MAIGPVFRAAGAKSAGTTGATAVAAPAGAATGDLEILIATTIAGGTITISTAGGSAWTAMTGSPIDVTAGNKLYVWWRIRQAGDSAPSVTPGSDHVCAGQLNYTAGTFDPVTPIEIATTGTETTSDTSFSFAPGTSTTKRSSLVLVVSTSAFDSNTAQVPVCTNANLTALNSRANYETLSGAGGGFGVTEGTLVVAGAVGTFACTYANASSKAYISFAIRPFAAYFTDTGATVTESILRNPNRPISDTGTTVSDSPHITALSLHISDTGATITESLSRGFPSAISDTGTTITESIARRPNRAISDTGTTFSESLPRKIARTLVETVLQTLPATGLLDDFNRADENPLASGALPNGPIRATGNRLQLSSNQVKSSGFNSSAYTTASYGPDCEVWATIATKTTVDGNAVWVGLRHAGMGTNTWSGYRLKAVYLAASTDLIQITRGDNGNEFTLFSVFIEFNSGDKFGLSARGSTLTAYLNQGAGWVQIGSVEDATYGAAGPLSLQVGDTAGIYTIDDFGGGTIVRESLLRRPGLALSDTGMSFSESLLRRSAPTLSDTGSTVTESIKPNVARPIADTGTTFSESLGRGQSRTISDTGTTVSDSILRNPMRPLTVTGVTVSDSLTRSIAHSLTDTGATVTESILRNPNRPISDTGATITDALARRPNRAIADTGATITDSLIRFVSHSLSDTGSTITDSLLRTPLRPLTDTGTTITDSLARPAVSRTISDTGATVSDSLLPLRSRPETDTGATISESIKVFISRSISDTGATVSESILPRPNRPLSDTGTTITDSIARVLSRTLSDTGATVTESLLRTPNRPLTDTGATVTDSLARPAVSRSLSDTGTTVSESILRRPNRPISDTGATVSDSLHITALSLHISDTGVSQSDALLPRPSRPLADTGVTQSDSLVRFATHSLSDTGTTVSESILRNPVRPISDTGLTQSDSLTRSISHSLSDTGATVTESILPRPNRPLTDTGTTISDSIAAVLSGGGAAYFRTPIQEASPTSDISSGTWTPSAGGSLFATIDEAVADDADYDFSAQSPVSADIFEVALADPTNIVSGAWTVSYRFWKSAFGGDRIDLTVRLMQGATQIAAWTETDISDTAATVRHDLTGGQVAAISDPTDLRLRIEAVKI